MTVSYENYAFRYKLKGKHIFVPSKKGIKVGLEIKSKIEKLVKFDDIYCHLNKGGHVAALHSHRNHKYFAHIDIERFFYSIGRNRIAQILKDCEIDQSMNYAKWSCVGNPYNEPKYSLPYGFIQSPILSTLVFMKSNVGRYLKNVSSDITVTVYVDDILMSSNNLMLLKSEYGNVLDTLKNSKFSVNLSKLIEPCDFINVFNCDLSFGRSSVSKERKNKFLSKQSNELSSCAFTRYCNQVELNNAELDLVAY